MYSIIDIEGNGGAYRKESIIDIAIYRYDGHEVTDQFFSLVNPEADITPYVQKLTGITNKMVKTAPKFHEIAKRIIEITEGTTLVGHNIDFDYRMLRQSFKQLGYEFQINTIDTIPLAQKLIPDAESYSLGKLVKSIGIPLVNAHRADSDARATLELFKVLISKDLKNDIIQQHFEESNAKTYINKIKFLTQDLPNDKGIMYFQDAKGKILCSDYVSDINKAAKKIFHAKSKKWEEVQKNTEQVHYDLVGSDLVAKLMMKSKGIKNKEKLNYGLYHQKGNYKVEKISVNPEEKPLLKFRSFTQGLKAVRYIRSREEFTDFKVFTQKISLRKRDEIWTLPGRTLGEKTFLILEKGKLISYGFFEFFAQLQSWEKIDNLKMVFKTSTLELQNDLQMALLKDEVEIISTPK